MIDGGHFALEDPDEIRKLIEENSWAVIISSGSGVLHASHLPVLLAPSGNLKADPEIVVEGHIARVDPQAASLLAGDPALLVFQGPHGYISPGWYESEVRVPTWNYLAVHLHGTPEILEGQEALSLLIRAVDHFESRNDSPWRLEGKSREFAERLAKATVCFRLLASRVVARAKLSQNKPIDDQRRVVAALEGDGPYTDPVLAGRMRHFLGLASRPAKGDPA